MQWNVDWSLFQIILPFPQNFWKSSNYRKLLCKKYEWKSVKLLFSNIVQHFLICWYEEHILRNKSNTLTVKLHSLCPALSLCFAVSDSFYLSIPPSFQCLVCVLFTFVFVTVEEFSGVYLQWARQFDEMSFVLFFFYPSPSLWQVFLAEVRSAQVWECFYDSHLYIWSFREVTCSLLITAVSLFSGDYINHQIGL